VNRYYCDFCKKSGCSGGHIRKHERGCTRNPNRECGICRKVEYEQQPTPALLAALEEGGVEAVKKLAQDCPACVMAAIHALRAKEPLVFTIEDGYENYIEFDYKTAAASFWADHQEEYQY
jgi:hypothetical protein